MVEYAVVTGANRGTGLAIANMLARHDMHVVTLGRTEGPKGERFTHVPCDLSDVGSVDSACRQVGAELPEISLLVLNAAVRKFSRLSSVAIESLKESVNVNLTSSALIVGSLLPLLRRTKGKIVVLGSHAASRFFEGGWAYSGPKAGLKALVETVLLEERQAGVTATLVSPGAISNRANDNDRFKMSPQSVASVIEFIAFSVPPDVCVGEIEIRPAQLRPQAVGGIDRLQDV